ncbi:MAG: hypothetical protein DI596_06055 [Azospira oryzae]|nr:MAG: hypothetical protein DI596_06055 [Azospira oryzae]PZP80607.1 MAG: hypothetical protein DI593_06055 [Azospira oryzae]
MASSFGAGRARSGCGGFPTAADLKAFLGGALRLPPAPLLQWLVMDAISRPTPIQGTADRCWTRETKEGPKCA